MEAALVGVDDVMRFVMWIKTFFKSQVLNLNDESRLQKFRSGVPIEHDNTSLIKLDCNRWKSSGKRTKFLCNRLTEVKGSGSICVQAYKRNAK